MEKKLLVTRKQFAVLEGVSRQIIDRRVRRGMPVCADGRIDVAAAKKWCADTIQRISTPAVTTDPSTAEKPDAKKSAAASSASDSLVAVRKSREQVRLQRDLLELAIRRRQFVEVEPVQAAVYEIATQTRAVIENWIGRVPIFVAHRLNVSEHAVWLALADHLRELQTELSSRPAPKLSDVIAGIERIDRGELDPDKATTK
jgi:hypothetical protein